MSRLVNYNGTEAANLFLGQGGFNSLSGAGVVEASTFNIKRWVGMMVIKDDVGAADIILTSEVGDDLTIDGAGVAALIGVVIFGPFLTVDAGSHDIIMYKG